MFSSEAIVYLSEKLLSKIKNHPAKPKMVLLLIDSLHAKSIHLQWARPMIHNFSWDLVLTYDQWDANEFDFTYMGGNIYSFNTECRPSKNDSDIYYVGMEKSGRNAYVRSLYEYLVKNDVKCNFHLI